MARKKHARPASSEELSLSRNVSADYYSSRLRSRTRKNIIRSIIAGIVAILLGGTVAIAAFVNDINTKITGSVDTNLKTVLATQEVGEPFYLLLIGIDKDEGRTTDPTYGKEDSGYRSDSIMLTRLDPSEKKVTMVSIHRDTLVDLGENGQQKINAAYAIGQETYTTEVISDFAGVPISHYAEVDMDGMAAVIDSVGGIDIDVPMDTKDPHYTGIDLKKGRQHLDGHTAALYCRCRHAYDALGDGDRYRAANQREVIRAVAQKVLKSDPATIASTVSTMASYVRTDMDVASIVSLALQFVGMNPETDIYTGMEPTTARYINATWFELCDTTAWRKMMRRVDQGLPPTEEGDVDALETSPEPSMDGYDDGLTYEQTNSGDDSYSETYYYEEPTYTDQTYYQEQTYQEPTYEESTYQEQPTTTTQPTETETAPTQEEVPATTSESENTGGGEPAPEQDTGDVTASMSAEAPAEAPVEAPTEAPVEAPVEAPAAPAEAPAAPAESTGSEG